MKRVVSSVVNCLVNVADSKCNGSNKLGDLIPTTRVTINLLGERRP